MYLLTVVLCGGLFIARSSSYESYCLPGYFLCGSTCLPLSSRCNGIIDCHDRSDELKCYPQCNVNLKDFYGVFAPPGYPGSLPTQSPFYCRWNIDSGDGRGLYIQFSSLQLSGTDGLVVYEDISGDPPQILRILDMQSNGKTITVESVSGRVTVLFSYSSNSLIFSRYDPTVTQQSDESVPYEPVERSSGPLLADRKSSSRSRFADCRDGSDEKNCGYTLPRKVIAAAVIGSLICATLLVVALGCTCRLYTTRAREYSIFAPLSRTDAELIQQQAPPSYGQLIAQGTIPPVEDFPTENPTDGTFMGNLRSLLQFLQQTPATPPGGGPSETPPRRRPPRPVRRLLRRLRRCGLLPPRSQAPQTDSHQNQTSPTDGTVENGEQSSAPLLPIKTPLDSSQTLAAEAEPSASNQEFLPQGDRRGLLTGMMQTERPPGRESKPRCTLWQWHPTADKMAPRTGTAAILTWPGGTSC
uniref:LDL receptor related protein 10 n=1 Tax=Leptobrachium leishanense TaxID=445787 RepID=A0A8C5ML42_9ANUR